MVEKQSKKKKRKEKEVKIKKNVDFKSFITYQIHNSNSNQFCLDRFNIIT